jgi:hypothetical protein
MSASPPPAPPTKTPGSAHEESPPPEIIPTSSPDIFSDTSFSGVDGRKRPLAGAETSHRGRKFIRREDGRARREDKSPLLHKSTGNNRPLIDEPEDEEMANEGHQQKNPDGIAPG